MNLFDLTGRVCVVTGATQGMGRASAERMAEHGARVVVTSRQCEDAEAVARTIEARYGAGTAVGLKFELQNRDDARTLVDGVLQAFGRIDGLMCSAAHVLFGKLEAIDPSQIDESLTINVGNYAALTKSAIPAMKAQGGGSIVYVLSTLGLFPGPSYLAYGVTKAALGHMTRVLAVDYGPSNIRVNAIVPGVIKNSFKHYEDPDVAAALVGRSPLRRFGEPDEIAAAAVLLMSPGGGYITGQTIVVDGGQLLRGNEGAEEAIPVLAARRARLEAARASGAG